MVTKSTSRACMVRLLESRIASVCSRRSRPGGWLNERLGPDPSDEVAEPSGAPRSGRKLATTFKRVHQTTACGAEKITKTLDVWIHMRNATLTMSKRGGRGSDEASLCALAFARFEHTRSESLSLCAPLQQADYEAQSMPDASPLKWHLAHTTWFYEVFVLEAFEANYAPHHPSYKVLFNSYYNAISERQARP